MKAQVLSPAMCRGARGLLDWTQSELAERSGVSRSTIRDYESARHDIHRATASALVGAFEGAGVVFADHGTQGVGLFLPRPAASSAMPDDGITDHD